MERLKIKGKVKNLMCAMVFCMMAVLLLSGSRAEAASKAPSCVKKQTVYYWSNGSGFISDLYSGFIYTKNLAPNAKITNIKSSNKLITAERLYGTENIISIHYNWDYLRDRSEAAPSKWSGTTSTITFRVKQNNKTYNLKCKVTLKLMASPVKTLKIGSSKNYASKFNGKNGYSMKLSGTKKITVKMKAGLKLESIRVGYKNGTWKNIKNGQKVSLKNALFITITYKHTKKPANYKAPKKWYGKVPSPLHEYITIRGE